ncbi:hypothetical protein K439DRAFT_1621582 [Ramaria rubella]|nr:hypothetical protein K439DRAFT_1621582 [Ramaria rubella]
MTGYTAQGIRDLAQQLWQSLMEHNQAPNVWGKATYEVNQYYHQCMYAKYGFLHYAKHHWKVKQIASEEYPLWSKLYKLASKPSCFLQGSTEKSSSQQPKA